jgi:hypothetical protein
VSQPIILDQSTIPGGKHRTATHRASSALKNDATLRRNSGRVSRGRSTARGEAPKEGHDRSRLERRYAANLRLTHTVLVFLPVIVGHYVRFGGAASAPSYVNQHVTVYSRALFQRNGAR